MTENVTPAHTQVKTSKYIVHYPAHPPRKDDPHYVDFEHYHKTHRAAARCYVGSIIGFDQCLDEHGEPAVPDNDFQPGLELHHAHVEFSMQNGVDLAALEKFFPGISNPDEVGAWVETDQNFMWLCTFHHRGAGGAHTATASDWEAEKFVKGLITKAD